MNEEFDDQVRASMSRFTSDIDVPAGLVAQARSHVRRQRRSRAGWLASGAAVAAAGAVLVGTLGGGAGPASRSAIAGGTAKPGPAKGGPAAGGPAKGGVTVQTTAVVVSRVDRALTKAASGNPVAFTRESTRGVGLDVLIPHGKPTEIHGNVTDTWSRGSLSHSEVLNSAGKVLFSTGTVNSASKSVQTMVSYPQQVWWRGTYAPETATRPQVGCTLGETDRTRVQWTREVKKLLSCGAKVAGVEQVDGVKTVKLKLSSSYKRACVASNYQSKCTPVSVGWHGVLWANAATFLPVRLVSHGHHYSFRIDFGWLAPTSANRALLRPVIPAGFRHV